MKFFFKKNWEETKCKEKTAKNFLESMKDRNLHILEVPRSLEQVENNSVPILPETKLQNWKDRD